MKVMNGDRHVGESGNHEKTTSITTNVSITMSSDRNSSSTTRRRRGWKMDGEGTDVGGRHGHEGRMREVMIYNAGTTYQSVRTPTVLVQSIIDSPSPSVCHMQTRTQGK